MSDSLTKCPACSGRGYFRCDCWPGDCICGQDEDTCWECEGEGWVDPRYDEAADEIERSRSELSYVFEFSNDYQFEAIGDERPNVVIPDPAPRCKLAIRKDTRDWFVATGVYFKPVSTDDGTVFRDVDGGIWRLIVASPTTQSEESP